MNILIDAHMVGAHETGNETYIRELAVELPLLYPEDRFTIAIAHHRAKELIGSAPNIQYCHVAEAPGPRLLFQLPILAQRYRADILHCTYAAPVWVPRQCHRVVTVHDASFLDHPEWFGLKDRLVLHAGVRLSMRQASAILTVSRFSKERLTAHYPHAARRITSVLNGVSPPPVPPDDPLPALDRYGIHTPYLFALGNLQPRKNIERLIQAFEHVLEKVTEPLTLVIGGQPHYQAEMIETMVATHAARAHIRLVGYVPEADLEVLYRNAYLFVYPSLYEGFGLPPLEAMARGTPVIASRSTALPEACGQAACLVDPMQVDDIAGAIVFLIEHPEEREHLIKKGLKHASALDWKRAARAIHHVYCTIAGSTH